MALPDLATEADLIDRGVTPTDAAPVFLEVASSLVREAAGSPIKATTGTFSVWAVEQGQWLDIPVRPISNVTAVAIDGSAVTDYKVIDGKLWRYCGWYGWRNLYGGPYAGFAPTEVTVTATVGLASVPAHIVQLVCDLAILGMNTATAGALDPRVVTERVDDYAVTFSDAGASVASAMTIPARTRLALRTRFGGGAGSLRFHS